jgi:hypothetical protein
MNELLFDVRITCGRDELKLSKCDSRKILSLLSMMNNVESQSPMFYNVDAPKLEVWVYQEDEDGESN